MSEGSTLPPNPPPPPTPSQNVVSQLAPVGVKPQTFEQMVAEESGGTDLDDVVEQKVKEEARLRQEVKPKPKEDLNDIDDDDLDDDDDIDDDEDDDDGEDSEEAAEEDTEAKAEGDEDRDEIDESDEERAEKYLGDDDLEKKLKVKIDGKYEERTLKDWMRLISSGAHNIKTFRTWEKQKESEFKAINEAKAQLGIANAKITPAWEKLKKNDVEGTIYELASSAGFNTLQVSRRLRDQMMPAIAQRLGLSEQEVRQRLSQMEPHNRALDIQEENEFLKTERQRLAEANKSKEPDALALEQRKIQDMMADHGISRNELKWAYEWLHEKAPNGMKPNISVEVLQNTILNRRFVDKAFDAIEARRPSLAKDDKFVDMTVRKLKKNPDWTTSRLAAWVEKKARNAADGQRKQQVDELTRDVSRKALMTKGKDGFANPDVGEKRAMRFNDLVEDDQSSELV